MIRVGIVGWTYEPWRGAFYPVGLGHEEELNYAASHVRAIEITGTYHGLQRPEAFESWAGQVSADFVFAVKAPRLITHILRLRDAQVPLANFIASGLLRLGIHLGPIVWQLPSNFHFEPKKLEPFLRLLPHDTGAAVALGRMHDSKLRAPAWLKIEARRPMRHAFEVRHESFRCKEFMDMLRAVDVAVVYVDSGDRPPLMDVTSDFVYCRLHGSGALRAGDYDNATLDEWAARIHAWARGEEPVGAERVGARARPRRRDVFVLFDNDKKVRAPANAMELIRRLRS